MTKITAPKEDLDMPVTLQRVTFQQTDNLGEIIIDNPPLNIFDADMFAELGNVVAQATASDFRALLIRAEGDTSPPDRTRRCSSG